MFSGAYEGFQAARVTRAMAAATAATAHQSQAGWVVLLG